MTLLGIVHGPLSLAGIVAAQPIVHRRLANAPRKRNLTSDTPFVNYFIACGTPQPPLSSRYYGGIIKVPQGGVQKLGDEEVPATPPVPARSPWMLGPVEALTGFQSYKVEFGSPI